MFFNPKVKYKECGVRVLSKTRINKKKLDENWWIEIFSYDTNTWEKIRDIEPVPKDAIITSFYEYGNGDRVPPFWDRVKEKMTEIQEEYSILKIYDKFEPTHYLGKNICGMDVYRADELYRILVVKPKK